MRMQTKHFGEIEYEPSLAFEFPDGLPGFAQRKKYVVLIEDEEQDTFCWLQSIEDGDLAFALINIYNVLPDYNPMVEKEDIAVLGDLGVNNLLVFNILVIPEDIREMRANLRAPIILNPNTRKGMQVVLTNEEYDLKYKIFDELNDAQKDKV